MAGWEHVEYLGFVSKEDISRIYRDTRIGFPTYSTPPEVSHSLPTDFFD